MAGAGRVLADQELLVQLLAAPQAHIFDGDITVGVSLVPHLESRQADHGAGKVVDLDRCPHLQHEHLSAACHGAGLNHKLGCFGDRHEIADHLRMGNGHGSACKICSARRLLAPMMLVGRTALSLDTSTTRSTPSFLAVSASASVPNVLFRKPAKGLASTIGTCL